MQYTKEQYKNAVQKALAAGDQETAEELAEEAAILYPEGYTSPETPYLEQVSQRASEFSPMEVLSEGLRQVPERAEKIGGPDYRPGISAYAPVAFSQAFRTGGELLAGGVSILISDSVREGFEEGWSKVKDMPGMKQAGQALGAGFEAWSDFSEKFPSFAETMETYVDIGAVLAPASKIDMAGPAAKAKLKYNTAIAEEKQAGINKLMDPVVVGESGYGGEFRSVGGPLDRTVYVPTEREQIMRRTLETVDGLDPNTHYARAHTVVSDEVKKANNELIAFINKSGNPTYDRQEIVESMQEAFAGLKESKDYVALSREAQKKANEYANIALKTINKEEPNALGLLAARREFDSFVNAGPRKGDVLDPTVETAKGAAGRFIRNVMNDKLKDITEGDVVHNSLDRMHNLLSARSVLRNKMYGEGNNRISRAFQRISSVANLPSTPLALYATVKTAGAAAAGAVAGVGMGTGAVLGAGAGVGIYTMLKAADKTTRLRFYAKMLSGTDKAIKAYKSDKNLVSELKADRAYIVYLMNEARQEEEENGK
jgi:hypothetical protein